MKHFTSSPRYTSTPHSDSESSTHSVRVSRLIEKIKQTQRSQKNSSVATHPDAFSYHRHHHQQQQQHYTNNNHVNSNSSDLIYSRIERDDSTGKRTVRERISPKGRPSTAEYSFSSKQNNNNSSTGAHLHHHHHHNHRTTVLLNNEDSGDTSPYDYESYRKHTTGFSGGGGGATTTSSSSRAARYFGEETDYEYDRVLSKNVQETRNATLNRASKFDSVDRASNNVKSGGVSTRGSLPKIILHEEAVAEIPNGGRGGVGTRSPSREFNTSADEYHHQHQGGSRFLGGLLTLKRNKKGAAGGHGGHAGPGSSVAGGSVIGGGTIRSNRSPSTRPYGSQQESPKYYVPYRSTPTLYESRYERDRMSSAGGSVLSNSSYINKHVSRSMSMKAPWEPKHRVNEINYYNDSYNKKVVEENKKDVKPSLSRSKSMPGKKLTSLIGNWVSKNNSRRGSSGAGGGGGAGGSNNEQEKLISSSSTTERKGKKVVNGVNGDDGAGGKSSTGKAKGRGNWGFTLLRFGKGKGGANKDNNNKVGKESTPTSKSYRRGDDVIDGSQRLSVSPVRNSGAARGYSSGGGVSTSTIGDRKRGGSAGTLLRDEPPRGGRVTTSGGGGTLLRNSYTAERRATTTRGGGSRDFY